MTITAIRLRERNRARGHAMRSYTMASGTSFTAGENGMPSALRIIDSPADIAEARSISQFEVIQGPSVEAITELLQTEMEGRARVGMPAIRAQIQGGAPMPAPRASVAAILAPTPIGEETAQETVLPGPEAAPLAQALPAGYPAPIGGQAAQDERVRKLFQQDGPLVLDEAPEASRATAPLPQRAATGRKGKGKGKGKG